MKREEIEAKIKIISRLSQTHCSHLCENMTAKQLYDRQYCQHQTGNCSHTIQDSTKIFSSSKVQK